MALRVWKFAVLMMLCSGRQQLLKCGFQVLSLGHSLNLEVYVVEERRRDDSGESACLTACWTALCCCCLWDMLT